jgi:hypothetical protein
MDPKLIMPIVFGALIAFSIYRRVRRNIGRQPLQPGRMQFRIVFLSMIGALIAFGASRDINLLGALLAGVAGGAVLGWFGLRHTKFEATGQGNFYTPHTYIGLAVSALLLGRVAYRVLAIYPSMQAAHQANEDPFASFQRSPLTLAILGVVIGYYICYFIGVLRRNRSLTPALAAAKDTTSSAL